MQIIENIQVKEKLYIEKLENGLTIMIIPKKGIRKKYVMWATHYGSIDNKFVVPGEENITEAIMSKFANNIDKDIISGLNSSVPEEPVLGGMMKCSKSAPLNALYYISKGENVEFKLGNIRLPLSQITHCWIEHNGEVAQTRNDMPDSDLKTKFSVKLVPNDIEKSKKLIIDLVNSINGTNESLDEWVDASGKRVSIPNSSTVNTSTQTVSQQQQVPAPHLPSGRYAVRIVDDHGRLRAEGTDGVNPIAWVAFPNHLRQFEGQQYEVDQLIWNGKNYRVSGNIVEI